MSEPRTVVLIEDHSLTRAGLRTALEANGELRIVAEAEDGQSGLDAIVARKPDVAVVDIGSNSVRLVVYEGLTRSPTEIFNEKALCGLGREVQSTGLLAADAVEHALSTLKRYRALCERMGVTETLAVATAACRDAKNGRAFIRYAERTLKTEIDILSGAREAELNRLERFTALGQLAGALAHEIKNPLNFINNFSALSVELIDELRQTLGGIPLDSKLRTEISEIADMLQSNLDKVVQHGKRADSIVKNMLLHSRQGSGEHRSIDINAIANEGLNLAYHGARAENPSFNITVHRNFDPAVGVVDGYPQEITRVLLNLISNGFYAATKRKAEAGDGFEPTLTATTKNLGDKVEIRIRDNGAGIPTEIKEKIFNPFFTTKPPGEGTGLGLSMSHDIIVKQHGGIIDVDTAPGAFTEFRIVLPRAVGASLIKSGEHI